MKNLSRNRRQAKEFRAACEELESRRLLTYQLASPLADLPVMTAASSMVSLARNTFTPEVTQPVISVALVNDDTTTTPVSSNQGSPIDYGFVDQNSVTPNSKTFRITNTGNAALNLGTILEPAGFFVTSPSRAYHSSGPSTPPNLGTLAIGASIDVTITQRADTGGDKSGTLVFQSNDPNTPSFDLPLAGFTHYKKLDVSVNSVELIADATTHRTQSVSLGSVNQGDTLQVTFHVTNTGDTLDLNLSAPTLPAGFSIVTPLPDTLAAGQSADLVLAVDTTTPGSVGSTVTFNSSDPLYALSPSGFSVPVSAIIHFRHLAATDVNGTAVSANSTVNFGTVLMGDTSNIILHMANTGDLPLTLGVPVVPAGFSLINSIPTTLAAGASFDAVFAIDTTTRGAKSGTFSIPTDEYAVPNFQLTLAGTILYKGIALTDGSTALSPGSSIDFSQSFVGDTATHTINVSNTGRLTLTGIAVTTPAGYVVLQDIPTTLSPGASAQLIIGIDTTVRGTKSGVLTIASSDLDNPSYAVNLTGKVLFKGLGITLADGTGVPYGTTTAIDFGTVREGDMSHEMAFNVTNTGHAEMSIQSVTLPSGYSIVTGLPATLAAGETEPLVIRVDAGAPGYYSSTMHIVSSDPDRPSFDIPVKAAVTLPVKLGVGGKSSITFTDADGTVSTVTMTGPGSAILDFLGNNLVSVAKKKVATIAGSSVILSGITFAGTNAGKTKVTITSKGGKVKTVDLMNISGSAINSLSAPAGRLVGTLSGKIGTLSLAAVAGGTVNLGAGSTVNVPTLTNATFKVVGNLKSLNVTSWNGGTLTAGSIDLLTATGAVNNVTFIANKNVGKINVKGNLKNSTLRSAGKITSITAGALMASEIYAGINPAKSPLTDALPFSTNAVLASLVTKSFSNSTIAARTISSLSLGTVKTRNSGIAEGIVGHTITSLIAKLDTGNAIKLTGVNNKVKLASQLKSQKATALHDLRIVIA